MVGMWTPLGCGLTRERRTTRDDQLPPGLSGDRYRFPIGGTRDELGISSSVWPLTASMSVHVDNEVEDEHTSIRRLRVVFERGAMVE